MSVLSPVRIDELLPAVKSLVDVTEVHTLLGGTGRVLVAQGDSVSEAFPTTDSTGFAARIILMNRNDSPREFLDMTIPVYWNLMVEVIPGGGYADAISNYIQRVCYMLLQHQTVTLTYSDVLFKIWRQSLSTQVRRDSSGLFYQTAIFQTILTPKQ